MSARQSAAVDQALSLIGKPRANGKPHTPYSAARAAGIALSSVYRALARSQPKALEAPKAAAAAPSLNAICHECNGTGMGVGDFPIGGCKLCAGTGRSQT